MENSAIIRLHIHKQSKVVDIEVPLDITANDLVLALNKAYDIGINTENMSKVYLKSENPIALLKGNRLLSDYNIHSGSIINIT
ncbi:EsaB/YukD family protein [uncultured Clostridium sp.]|uniref:EsaB/YukD family protein n=1 Tax=uncultured Clostridium sp. TaxID=59620 RepID=UPI0025EB0431|nr:EsaB/YukD family protein [uncultured Clostridium sp.]